MNDVQVHTRRLERLMLQSVVRINPDILEPRFYSYADEACENIVVGMKAYVWAEEIQKDTSTLTVEWPASLWQAFKDRWFPRWALRRWPVRLLSKSATVTFKVKAKLPEYKYVAPRDQSYALEASVDWESLRFRGDKPENDE